MKLEFVDHLPGRPGRAGITNTLALAELVETLAGYPNEWAVYPHATIRPDLADATPDNKILLAHIRGIQQKAKKGAHPFDEYQVEVAIRRGVGYIRVVADERRLRGIA